MLHQTQEITRLLIITLPMAFLAMAGLDLMLRIAGAFASTSAEIEAEQAVDAEPMPALEPVVRTSDETQTQQAVEFEALSELEPTCPELKSEQPAIETPLSQLKRYKLHGHEVVPVASLSITLPATIKRYKLRGMAVVRVSDIA